MDSSSRFLSSDVDGESISTNILSSISKLSWIRSSIQKPGSIISKSADALSFTGVEFEKDSTNSMAHLLSSLKLEIAGNSSSTTDYVEFPQNMSLNNNSEYSRVHAHFTKIDTNPLAFVNDSQFEILDEDENLELFEIENIEPPSEATNISRRNFGKIISGITRMQLKDEKETEIEVNNLNSPIEIGISFKPEKHNQLFKEMKDEWINSEMDSNMTDITDKFECRFLDPKTNLWSSEGCESEVKKDSNNDNDEFPSNIVCRCSHLTNFAVVRIMSSYDYNIPSQPISIDQITNNWATLALALSILIVGLILFISMIIWDVWENKKLGGLSDNQFAIILDEVNTSNLKNSQNFWHRWALLLKKDHRLFGFIYRRRYDPYTRSQRISVIITSILVNMAINSAVYSIDSNNLFDFQESLKFILLGAITTICVTPIPVVLGILWRSVKPPSLYEKRMKQIEKSEEEFAESHARSFPWVFLGTMITLMCLCTVFCVITVWQFYGTWWEALILSVVVILFASIFSVFKIRSVNFTKSTEKNYRLLPYYISSLFIWIVCLVLGAGSAAYTIYVGVANNLSQDNPGKWILSNVTSIVLNICQFSSVIMCLALTVTSLKNPSSLKESKNNNDRFTMEEEMESIY
eukprot:gb/GECH01010931.1/.p1 GENE.gb/GECH01010931.1/~~gb/GECH01010931.1/.p1  ORF type:complete len:635 (+),score=154.02 gb/GECH01010931.1/:1-1905(+)